jgi:hypothetical protein
MLGMSERPIEPGSEEGWAVVDLAAHAARRWLGDGLLSAYAIGSLAHGGFRQAVSDIDFAVLTDDGPGRELPEIAAATAADVRHAHPLGGRLSIFYAPWSVFSDPPPRARFPAIDRYDLVRYGVLVHGIDLRATCARAPTATEIRQHAVDFALRYVTAAQLSKDLRELRAGGVTVHDATKLVLWPVRLQHVCDTGKPTGNADAVEHYLSLRDARHRSLVGDALSWRETATIGDPDDALGRIAREIYDLHAEVFQQLSERSGIPRRDELAKRSRKFTR